MVFDVNKCKKILACFAAVYLGLVLMIFGIAHEAFRRTAVTSDALSPNITIRDLTDSSELHQRVRIPADKVESLSILTGSSDLEREGNIILTLRDSKGTVLTRVTGEISSFESGSYHEIILDEPLSGYRDQYLDLMITFSDLPVKNIITLYAGNTLSVGRFDIVRQVSPEDCYRIGEDTGEGMLCVKINGYMITQYYILYWIIACGVFVVLSVLVFIWWRQAIKGQNNPLVAICTLFIKYSFLFSQLVIRNFKKKYKRSILGMGWSILNPMLTMSIQYIIFSTIFKNNINNYPLYLLVGIVFMNFFTESITTGMVSITENAQIIKKVYFPKYILPVSHVATSLINFFLTFIPLTMVMLVTRASFHMSMFLLIFDLLCLFGFVLGVCFIMTTAMTFFQDTQFLWSVISMLWAYLTPVFYPETIIPQQFVTLFHMNPMYQYVTFARICIIDGVSPAPTSYLWCIISSLGVLLLGIFVFKRYQDKFVLNL